MENKENDYRPRWVDRSGGMVPGLILILLGSFFLLSNFTDFELDNWWALFILIPAFSNLSRAWELYRYDGSLSRGVRRHLIVGLFFVLLSGAFLLNVNLDLVWPVFLILAGLGLIFGAF